MKTTKFGRPTSNPKPHKVSVRVNDTSKAGLEKYCSLENSTQAEAIQSITLPLINYTTYPTELLDNLEEAIQNGKDISEHYLDNKANFDILNKALEPVLEIRNKALDFPDIDISKIEPGMTVKKVVLDLRAEKLIDETLRLQSQLLKVMYG